MDSRLDLALVLLRRSGGAALTVVGVVTVVFFLIHLLPGDPIDTLLGDQASEEDRAALRARYSLDRPLPVQYLLFLGNVATGTLGHSYRDPERTVASRVAAVLPDTLALAVASMAVALALALPLGLLAALRRGTIVDGAATGFALAGLAIPNIWLGPMLVAAFCIEVRLFPLPGVGSDTLAGLVLPAVTLGTALAAILTRLTRASVLEVLSAPHVVAARARGLSSLRLLRRHVLRNALGPVVTVGGIQLGALLAGAVVTEKIFERPGLGTLFLEAFYTRDIPVVQGCVIVAATAYVAINLLTDLLYVVLDPRVRLAR